MAKTIITAALTGAVTPAGYHIPETPEQIVQAAYECWQLGAAVVHIHTRAADGKGAMNTQAFREIMEGIRAHKDCDVIINCTSSGASPEHPATDEERFLHHMTVPGIEMGSYDAGSFNWMPGGVFVNSPQFLQKLGDAYLEKGIKPEIEIFDAGMLGIADYFVKKGHLSTPCHYQFCLGVLGGMPATVENLIYLKDRIPAGSTWSAFGIGAAVPVRDISPDSGLIDAVSLMTGGAGGTLVRVVALLFLVTLFGNMISWSMGVNSTAAYAADRGDMPAVFARRWKRNDMPVGSAVTSGIVASAVCLLGAVMERLSPDSSLFWSFFALNLVMLLLSYLPVFPAFLTLRRKFPDRERPFRVPGRSGFLKWLAYVPMALIILSIIFTAVPLSWDRETLTGVLPITVGSVLSVLLGEVLIAARRPQH